MNQDVPDHLVINLLALAEVAPDLPPEVLERLAGVAPGVEANKDALAKVSTEIYRVLRRQPAFARARAAWDAEGTRLDVEPIIPPNPPGPARSTVEFAADVAREAVECPGALAKKPEVLRWLACLIQRRWPREDS